MSELSSEQHDQLLHLLQTQQKELLAKAREGLELSMNRERSGGRDSLDESSEEELFSTELRLRDREKWLLAKIRGAMQRVKERSVNECEDCDEPIGFKRLLARPVTTLCIECKEEREEREAASEGPSARKNTLGLPTAGFGSDDTGTDTD